MKYMTPQFIAFLTLLLVTAVAATLFVHAFS